ncbi:MAG: nickel/cobalt efflux transporter [Comamonas sp.]
MTDFSTLLQQGNAWFFIPSAIALGALHGLEPGHSKTMMAAFIVAIRGTLSQAVLLGLSATISHTLVVWAVAMAGLYFGNRWSAEASEPYLQLASGLLILGVAAWMLWRTWSDRHPAHHDHDHGHQHHHDHAHDHHHSHDHGDSHQDAHERAHAEDIRRRFTDRPVTTGQIVVFGLTGGLIPCPASITVLLLCLQLKQIALGATLVLGFSVGLALTLVASGALAALSVRHVSQRWSGFGEFARKAPYVSGVLILLVGLYIGYHGWRALPA